MSFKVTFRSSELRFTEIQFTRLVDFADEVVTDLDSNEAEGFVAHLKSIVIKLEGKAGLKKSKIIQIDRDFPNLEEKRFWSGVFLDIARGIFDRSLGAHHHLFWQAKAVHQAYTLGKLFEVAVREKDSRWSAETIDRTERKAFIEANKEAKKA